MIPKGQCIALDSVVRWKNNVHIGRFLWDLFSSNNKSYHYILMNFEIFKSEEDGSQKYDYEHFEIIDSDDDICNYLPKLRWEPFVMINIFFFSPFFLFFLKVIFLFPVLFFKLFLQYIILENYSQFLKNITLKMAFLKRSQIRLPPGVSWTG